MNRAVVVLAVEVPDDPHAPNPIDPLVAALRKTIAESPIYGEISVYAAIREDAEKVMEVFTPLEGTT